MLYVYDILGTAESGNVEIFIYHFLSDSQWLLDGFVWWEWLWNDFWWMISEWVCMCDGMAFERFSLLSDWVLNDLCDGVVSGWFLKVIFCDFKMISQQFLRKKWFLGMIAWSHIDFWMVVCDEMIFDDLVRFWTDFVWWKWFWNGSGWLRNDFWMLLCGGKGFGMIFELFFNLWSIGLCLLTDFRVIMPDGLVFEWCLNNFCWFFKLFLNEYVIECFLVIF